MYSNVIQNYKGGFKVTVFFKGSTNLYSFLLVKNYCSVNHVDVTNNSQYLVTILTNFFSRNQ